MANLFTSAAVRIACVACVAVTSASGCYWSSPPSTPHRNIQIQLAELGELTAPAPKRLTGARVVVLGRFDTVAANPIGGLYDRKDYEVSPLQRTYFFRDGAVELFEHVSDGLRASGLMVLKDYAGHAEPALLESSLRARNPVLVTGTISALQHDQIREKGNSQDYEAGIIEIDVRVLETDGAVRLNKSYRVRGYIHFDGQTEFLKLLGWKLAQALSEDTEFVAAVAAQSGGAVAAQSGGAAAPQAPERGK